MNKILLSIDLDSLNQYEAKAKEVKEKCTFGETELKAMGLNNSLSSIDSIYSVTDNVAQINVCGVLKPKLDIFDVFFGLDSTSYDQIIRSLEKANNDSSIEKLKMFFDSPGGYVSGMAKVADYMRSIDKPIVGIVEGMCASACYFIASQCDEIQAQNEFSQVGSVGVMVTTTSDKNDNYIEFRSKNAPFKALGADSEEGKKIIQENINAMEEIFINYISEGRGVETSFVEENFGKGKTMLATEAVNAKMVDKIKHTSSATPSNSDVRHKANNETQKDSKMEAKDVQKIVAEALESGLAPIAQAIGDVKTDLAETKAKAEADAKKAKAEDKRKADFTALSDKYPNQKELIAQAQSEGKECDFDLMCKISDTEVARVKAKAEAEDNSDDVDDKDSVKPKGSQATAMDKSKLSFNEMLKALNPLTEEVK